MQLIGALYVHVWHMLDLIPTPYYQYLITLFFSRSTLSMTFLANKQTLSLMYYDFVKLRFVVLVMHIIFYSNTSQGYNDSS